MSNNGHKPEWLNKSTEELYDLWNNWFSIIDSVTPITASLIIGNLAAIEKELDNRRVISAGIQL